YDTKRIKGMAYALAAQGDTAVVGRVGVLGALRLYLDFINLFLFILRLLGRRRR
ncbi:MAG: Bax inhibitor-1 family protein, partial [Anaerolineales bacterium]|nr:Bax inhibitor-1 family protein [Anaerolineales bacterium]